MLYLLPKEEPYIDFLAIRKVPVKERPQESGAPAVFDDMRKLSLEDRDVYEKGIIAFVSQIRSYKAHLVSDLKDYLSARF